MNTTVHPAPGAAGHRRLAMLVCALAAALVAPAQQPPPAGSEEPTKLETFSVLGSRIKRLDAETPSPVVRITKTDLENTGFTTVDDALRALPFTNGVSLQLEGTGNSFASGTSSVNLRGLGNNNTLVLINGRRAVPSGSGTFNGFQSVVDLRQIPTSAIESIEILKDGASAIYGSDAVAGAINITLKRSFSGMATDVSFGNTFGTDSHEITAFVIMGASTAKTSIVATFDFSRRAAIKDSDLEFARTADLRRDTTAAGQLELDSTGTIVTGADLRSSSTFPARFFLPGTANVRTFAGPTTDPSQASMVLTSRATGAGFYDFQRDTRFLPETESRGFGFYAKHDFTDTLHGFADIFFKRAENINHSAPSPFSTTDRGAGTNNRLVVPRTSPFNPFGDRYQGAAGQAIELNTFRLVNAGPRVVDVNSDYPRYLIGLGGTLPKDWTWEASYMFAQGSFDNASPGVSFDNRIQEALNGLNIDGQFLYANPFGPEDPRVTDHYAGTNPTRARFTANLYDISAGGNLFDTRAGAVALAAGAEFRTETIADVRTLENENGNIVGGSEGFGFHGKRNVTSLYAEMSIPLLKSGRFGTAEMQLAGRYEDYSDFGTTTKPKVAVAWRPTKWLMMRGSFSQSFKAPDLAYLYTKGSVSFTGGQAFDPRRLDQPSAQIKTVGRGNPDLQPEEADTTALGLIFEVPKGPLKGLSFDVGYFKFDQTDLITRDTAQFTLNNELILPAGRVVRKALTPAESAAGFTVGILDFVATDWYNANNQIYEGYDLGMAYIYNHKSWGNFRFGAAATYIANFERQAINSIGVQTLVDLDGTDSVPLWRGNATLSWRRGDWAASLYATYVGEYPPQLLGVLEPDVEAQWRFNPQVSYAGFWNTKFTVGVRNVLNDPPPRYIDNSNGYNSGVNSAEPAFWYVRASREF